MLRSASRLWFAAMMLVGLWSGRAAAREGVIPPARDNFHLFLLVGQSNMAGRGKVAAEDRVPHPRVLMLDKSGAWLPAADPLHFDKPGAVGVGLGKTFGEAVAEANPGITVGLIPCAVGGSPIDSWLPGVYYPPTRSHPWDDTLRRAGIALPAGVLKGILWHQGESDSQLGLAEAYESKLHELIARLRQELRAPGVPFLAGQMGRFDDKPWDAARIRVDRAHQDLLRKVDRTAFVAAGGLQHKGDQVHFDAASYRELGRRYADAYGKLAPALDDALRVRPKSRGPTRGQGSSRSP